MFREKKVTGVLCSALLFQNNLCWPPPLLGIFKEIPGSIPVTDEKEKSFYDNYKKPRHTLETCYKLCGRPTRVKGGHFGVSRSHANHTTTVVWYLVSHPLLCHSYSLWKKLKPLNNLWPNWNHPPLHAFLLTQMACPHSSIHLIVVLIHCASLIRENLTIWLVCPIFSHSIPLVQVEKKLKLSMGLSLLSLSHSDDMSTFLSTSHSSNDPPWVIDSGESNNMISDQLPVLPKA